VSGSAHRETAVSSPPPTTTLYETVNLSNSSAFEIITEEGHPFQKAKRLRIL
jgi:hypothetical protein